MQQELLDQLKQKLLQKKADVTRIVERMQADSLNMSLRDSISELSTYDNHPADVGSEVFERSKDAGLLDNEDIQLHKINDALSKMEQGTYGTCSKCGRQIDIERLKALPETTLCKQCREDFEGAGSRHPRPIEEKVLTGYEGLADGLLDSEKTGPEDEIGFDGEDTWQQLTRTSEHAKSSNAGAYYGPMDPQEDRGHTEGVDAIPYFKGADGMNYKNVHGQDDEDLPGQRTIGDEGWNKIQRDE